MGSGKQSKRFARFKVLKVRNNYGPVRLISQFRQGGVLADGAPTELGACGFRFYKDVAPTALGILVVVL